MLVRVLQLVPLCVTWILRIQNFHWLRRKTRFLHNPIVTRRTGPSLGNEICMILVLSLWCVLSHRLVSSVLVCAHCLAFVCTACVQKFMLPVTFTFLSLGPSVSCWMSSLGFVTIHCETRVFVIWVGMLIQHQRIVDLWLFLCPMLLFFCSLRFLALLDHTHHCPYDLGPGRCSNIRQSAPRSKCIHVQQYSSPQWNLPLVPQIDISALTVLHPSIWWVLFVTAAGEDSQACVHLVPKVCRVLSTHCTYQIRKSWSDSLMQSAEEGVQIHPQWAKMSKEYQVVLRQNNGQSTYCTPERGHFHDHRLVLNRSGWCLLLSTVDGGKIQTCWASHYSDVGSRIVEKSSSNCCRWEVHASVWWNDHAEMTTVTIYMFIVMFFLTLSVSTKKQWLCEQVHNSWWTCPVGRTSGVTLCVGVSFDIQ